MAAGLGFKTFTTGEVLTAADVNGYLMQGILVFASEAARNAAITSPQEGQFAFTKDNNSLWYYTGSAWAASGATGDIEGVTAGTGLTGGGTSGTVTLNFDVTNYGGGSYAAGKNKIINGDFNINQRGFTSATSSGTYGFDRWRLVKDAGGTVTMSAQTFTLGTAPVSGYESKNFLRIATSGQTATSTYTFPGQKIESVRTFAGETITISFWAKAASGTPKIAVEVAQTFGTGGSPSSNVNTYAGQVTLNTAWTRYSVTVSVPSISGKTIGTNNDDCLDIAFWTSAGSDFNARTGSLGIQTATIDFWGVQAESGSVATAFQTATGTLAGELAACQRYLPVLDNSAGTDNSIINGYAYGTNGTIYTYPFAVQARVAPTGMTVSGGFNGYSQNTPTTITPTFGAGSVNNAALLGAFTITAGEGSRIYATAGAKILFTGCEL